MPIIKFFHIFVSVILNHINNYTMKKTVLLLAMGFALTTQTLFAQVPSFVPTNGLVGYWPFSGNADDVSGNGNNGTVNGATLTTDRFGNSNSAYNFDGINNHILVSNNSTLSGFADITISFWVNISQFPSESNPFSGLVAKWYGSGNCGGVTDNYACYLRTNNQFVVGTNQYRNYPNMLQTPSNLSTSNWYHFVMVHNSSTGGSIYINGTLVSTYNTAGALCSSTNPLYFGCDNGLGTLNRFFDGKLDDIGIWNRALSETEIATIYNGVSYSDTCNNVSGSLTQGLIGYWPFCGNANDYSVNGNNGTVNGATLTTDRFGNTNSAYDFNGTTNYISVMNNSSLNPSSITISGWISSNANAQNTSDGVRSIVTKWNQTPNCGGDGENFNVQLSVFNSTNVIAFATSQNSQIANALKSSTDVIGLNTWKHFVFTHDPSSGQKLYINGVLISSNNTLGVLCATTNNLYFGADKLNAALWRYFNGKIDDIGIWNRALTPSEVTQLYNQNQCSTNITVTDTLIINVGQLSYTNPIAYANNIIIAPNPASTQININFNNITDLNGGTLKVINSLGQEVATTPITTSGTNSTMQLATWGGTGMYFVQIINPQGQIVDIKKIILQ
jgi:hypothetical protein